MKPLKDLDEGDFFKNDEGTIFILLKFLPFTYENRGFTRKVVAKNLGSFKKEEFFNDKKVNRIEDGRISFNL